ncbi:MAG: methylated-DNA--[protein]-cysteine S-methyltransferase [Nocardioidaceae bacterium]
MTAWTQMESPIGTLCLVTDGRAVTGIRFDADGDPGGRRDDTHRVLVDARTQLDAYFAGDLEEFDLPLSPSGTQFQRRVWQALTEIGYGHTATYGQIAQRLGLVPGASRAVGLANGRNPIPVVIPCHRVIGSNGKLVGYGGGIDRKRALLNLESAALF